MVVMVVLICGGDGRFVVVIVVLICCGVDQVVIVVLICGGDGGYVVELMMIGKKEREKSGGKE